MKKTHKKLEIWWIWSKGIANSPANDFTFYGIDLGGLNGEVFRQILLILRDISSSLKQAGKATCWMSIPHPLSLMGPPSWGHPPARPPEVLPWARASGPSSPWLAPLPRALLRCFWPCVRWCRWLCRPSGIRTPTYRVLWPEKKRKVWRENSFKKRRLVYLRGEKKKKKLQLCNDKTSKDLQDWICRDGQVEGLHSVHGSKPHRRVVKIKGNYVCEHDLQTIGTKTKASSCHYKTIWALGKTWYGHTRTPIASLGTEVIWEND